MVDQNCRKLLRVLTGIEETYAGTSNQTPGGRAQLKKQLDRLQLEKAEYREKREALILRLSQQPGACADPVRSSSILCSLEIQGGAVCAAPWFKHSASYDDAIGLPGSDIRLA